MVEAKYDRGADAMYLVADPTGDVEVRRLSEVL